MSIELFMRSIDKYDNESPDSEILSLGASLLLVNATAGESNCFVSSVNDWQFCDITVDLTLDYSASNLPATISCSLASSDEGASAQVIEPTDIVVNMEHRDSCPVLGCRREPNGVSISLPYNHGTFTRLGEQ